MVKVIVTAKYEETFSDEDMEDITETGKSFEESYKDSFEFWRFDDIEYNFQYYKET